VKLHGQEVIENSEAHILGEGNISGGFVIAKITHELYRFVSSSASPDSGVPHEVPESANSFAANCTTGDIDK
jgi:hypothetical protein